MSSKTTTVRWADVIEYPETRVKSKILLENKNRYTLMSLAMGMHIAEHISGRNATVNVIEGQGKLLLEGKEAKSTSWKLESLFLYLLTHATLSK